MILNHVKALTPVPIIVIIHASHPSLRSFNRCRFAHCVSSPSLILHINLSMTSVGALSYLSLFLMSPKNTKLQSVVIAPTPDEDDHPTSSSDPELLPEIDLISLDEPESVDLGDFTNVWQHLASFSNILQPVSEADVTEIPASRKQFIQKLEAVKNTVIVNIPLDKYNTKRNIPLQSQKPKTCGKSKTPKAPPLKGRKKQVFAYSSPEDDIEDSAWYSSSYEDKRNSLTSPRRKSFLYVPPSFSSPTVSPKSPSIVPAPPAATDRRRNLIQKLISNYPGEVNQILIPQSTSPSNGSYLSSLATLQSPDLHIFIDNSNILIGFYDNYKSKHKITDPFFRPPKFDFHAFSTIIERGRPIARKILVGSNPLTQPVSLAESLGYEVFILERVVDTTKRNISSGNPYASDSATRTPQREKKKEQAVDEILHLKILECLLDVEKPGTIVLATGDAAPAEFSPEGGFLKCIKRALTRGWFVELVCWRKSMSRLWRDKIFRIEWRNTFSVVELDDYVDELVLE